jgi:hypothetical protein
MTGVSYSLGLYVQVISNWMPYNSRDHPGNDIAESYYVASRQLRGQGTWACDCHTTTVLLQPSDIIVAGSDGLWDAVHFFGQAGLATRQLIRSLYLGEQLDPGQLAERLLLRAWAAVQEARSSTIIEQVPPFMEEVCRTGLACQRMISQWLCRMCCRLRSWSFSLSFFRILQCVLRSCPKQVEH